MNLASLIVLPRHSSLANRQLGAELDGIFSIVACTIFARDGTSARNAALAIANLAFESQFAISKCLMARADMALCKCMNAINLLSEDDFLEAA
mmetsp:Transcript_26763/g.80247  ORF Transcript_26763/g.80247 Transcript_26763/m.80247 type:complete len:93 (-) Transcript_26763:989-1267(-)